MRPARVIVSVLTVGLAVCSWTAFGAETESGTDVGPNSTRVDRSSGTASRLSKRQPPEAAARTQYNIGIRGVENGDELAADAARETDAQKRGKLETRSRAAYEDALEKMTKATKFNPRLVEAWDAAGSLNRKLGLYDAALVAYDKALSLKPDYPQAVEGRGLVYLGLHRVDDAKGAYLKLFDGQRELAAKLLKAMQEYVGQRRGVAGVDAAQLDAFAAWVHERSGSHS